MHDRHPVKCQFDISTLLFFLHHLVFLFDYAVAYVIICHHRLKYCSGM